MQTGRRTPRRAALTAAAVAAMTLSLPGPAYAAGVSVDDLSGPLSADDLAQSLAGAGVRIDDVSYTGAGEAAGRFTGGGDDRGSVIGFDSGVVLSTGVAQVGGSNTYNDGTGYSSRAGDPDLDSLGAGTTEDVTVLAFDVTPDRDTLYFNYVFASEEYNKYVYEDVSDVFGFFVSQPGGNGPRNCAVVADGPDGDTEPDPVSIDTVNGGKPFGSANAANPGLYRNNDPDHGGSIAAEPDGFTTVLRCVASVTPHEKNRLKLAIGDVGDGMFDSWVFIQAGSITTSGDACGDRIDNDRDGTPNEGCPAPRPATTTENVSASKGPAEGSQVRVGGSAKGPEGARLSTRWSYTPAAGTDAGANCTFGDPREISTSVSCTDDGVYTLTLSATDGKDSAVGSATLTLSNAAPSVTIRRSDVTEAVTGRTLDLAAAVQDQGGNDTRTCRIQWGDRNSEPGRLADGVCRGSHAFATAGIYDIKVTVTDDDGGRGTDVVTVVVADAPGKDDGGGFVIEGER